MQPLNAAEIKVRTHGHTLAVTLGRAGLAAKENLQQHGLIPAAAGLSLAPDAAVRGSDCPRSPRLEPEIGVHIEP